ncbi:MAG: hypothetical protein H0X29_12175 [Parachlamydiaceae bacterium]|nr:hypothetical protein [Parachlamydiaceae bacterium]
MKNPTFRFFLWIDQHTFTQSKSLKGLSLKEFYKDKLGTNVEIFDIFDKSDQKYNENICTSSIRYEIDKVMPNYGASSDLLRYRILYQIGGCYFDSDIEPAPNSLIGCDAYNSTNNQHVLYIDHLSQLPKPHEYSFERFELSGQIEDTFYNYGLGNDAFICTAKNPLMRQIMQEAEDNYRLIEKQNTSMMYKLAYAGHNLQGLTIETTGPSIVQNVIKRQNLIGKSWELKYSAIIDNVEIII